MNDAVSRRSAIKVAGVATLGTLTPALLATGNALAQTSTSTTGHDMPDWFVFQPDLSNGAAAQPVSCGFDFRTLSRTLTRPTSILLVFETQRALITLRIACQKPDDLLQQIVQGKVRDLRDKSKLGISVIELNDYTEWQKELIRPG
jgi:hypothetical protein